MTDTAATEAPLAGPIPAPEPGVYRGIPEEAYFRWAAMSQSRCKTLDDRSPKVLRWEIDHPRPPTKAMDAGKAAHKLALEPFAFNDVYVVGPVCDKRTKAGKEAWAELEELHAGKKVLPAADYLVIQGMAAELFRHPDAREYLSGGESEVSIVWDDEIAGVRCKARIDYLNPPVIPDMKTTRTQNAREFGRSIWEYGYDRQAAMYLDGCRALGLDVDMVIFVTVEHEAPFDVAPWIADKDVLACGRFRYRRALDTFARCERTGDWHGKCPGTERIAMPDYALKDVGIEREFLL